MTHKLKLDYLGGRWAVGAAGSFVICERLLAIRGSRMETVRKLSGYGVVAGRGRCLPKLDIVLFEDTGHSKILGAVLQHASLVFRRCLAFDEHPAQHFHLGAVNRVPQTYDDGLFARAGLRFDKREIRKYVTNNDPQMLQQF